MSHFALLASYHSDFRFSGIYCNRMQGCVPSYTSFHGSTTSPPPYHVKDGIWSFHTFKTSALKEAIAGD